MQLFTVWFWQTGEKSKLNYVLNEQICIKLISSSYSGDWDVTPCSPVKSADVSKKNNAVPPSLGSNGRPSTKLAEWAGFLLSLLFDPENGSDTLLRNVGGLAGL
jgi:hypothetical protein